MTEAQQIAEWHRGKSGACLTLSKRAYDNNQIELALNFAIKAEVHLSSADLIERGEWKETNDG